MSAQVSLLLPDLPEPSVPRGCGAGDGPQVMGKSHTQTQQGAVVHHAGLWGFHLTSAGDFLTLPLTRGLAGGRGRGLGFSGMRGRVKYFCGQRSDCPRPSSENRGAVLEEQPGEWLWSVMRDVRIPVRLCTAHCSSLLPLPGWQLWLQMVAAPSTLTMAV